MPVGATDEPDRDVEEAVEAEDVVAAPVYTFAQGHGRFVVRYSRLATALGNFEQGQIQTESAIVARWLTSGICVATSRAGWNLLSPRYTLTKLEADTLRVYYSRGYSTAKKMIDRINNMVALYIQRTSGTSSVNGCHETPRSAGSLRAISKRSENNWGSVKRNLTAAIKPGAWPLPQGGVAPHRQLIPPIAASRLLHTGVGNKAIHSSSLRTRVQSPVGLLFFW